MDVDVDDGPMGPRPDMITPPMPPPMLVVASGMVLVPTTRSDGLNETGVPEMVMPGPPGTRVVPAMAKPVGLAVNVWPASVKTALVGIDRRGIVLVPMTRPDEPREMGVPEIVTAGCPGRMEVPAMLKPVGFAVKVWPPIVNTALLGDGREMVLVPTTRPDAPNDIGVPDMVTAGCPGNTEIPPTLNPVGLAVKV